MSAWNDWRKANPTIRPNLNGADFSGYSLSRVNLHGASLVGANLSGANLKEAGLGGANLMVVNLSGANLIGANLGGADLLRSDLSGANLEGATLIRSNLVGAQLADTDLSRAHLGAAYLNGVDLSGVRLPGANLDRASLVEANLTDADLTGCRVYGISAWGLKISAGTKQENLIITPPNEPEVTVDNIEVAQFIYLLLHYEKVRDVIDTIGKKTVLILGRFTSERKAVLDAVRDELRKRDYLPIVFDFEKPSTRDTTATISTLAHLARFIIADLTDPKSVPHELATVIPTTPVPVQPIILAGEGQFAMFADMQRRYHWVLATQRYDTLEQLIADLGDRVIRPAEAKVLELRNSVSR